MKTRFYKILYKSKYVVYVGVTTREITERFKQHVETKGLNENYSVIEFDCVEHPEFTTLEIFYAERRKVVELEQKYIKEELEKGSKLLNISKGGEWGCTILEKLRKEDFKRKFGSYDKYKEYKKKIEIVKKWLVNWISNRSENRVKIWLSHWISHRSENEVKVWLGNWIKSRSENKVKVWVGNWISDRSKNKVKVWVGHWISNRSGNKVKVWVGHWIYHRRQLFDFTPILYYN